MKYTVNHPQKDFAKALHLSKDQERRLDNAVLKAFNEVRPDSNGTVSNDEIIAIIAPYIKTPEEAFYAATTMLSAFNVYMNKHLSKSN